MLVLLLSSVALAGALDSEAVFEPRPLAGRPVFDLRLGVTRADPTQHPYICAEGAPLPWLTLEGCGTGSGFLHHGDEPDMAHFRTRLQLVDAQKGRADGALLAGVGFAEVQRGIDEHGFRFGEATTEDQNEAAGPEASLGAKGRLWFDPRAYLVMDVTTGVAYIPAAPTVIGRGGPVVPFAAVSAGLGF